jgi:hypothetical protein
VRALPDLNANLISAHSRDNFVAVVDALPFCCCQFVYVSLLNDLKTDALYIIHLCPLLASSPLTIAKSVNINWLVRDDGYILSNHNAPSSIHHPHSNNPKTRMGRQLSTIFSSKVSSSIVAAVKSSTNTTA